MYERVSKSHPDKIADRIAGAIVDLAYKKNKNPKIAVEVLIGHGHATIIVESNVVIRHKEALAITERIAGISDIKVISVKQDEHLAKNQEKEVRCGDNGIFKGCPMTYEEKELTRIAKSIYAKYQTDGKYILDTKSDTLIICQSNAKTSDLKAIYPFAIINPLGEWTGGTDVDTGATNRKLGSDMGNSVTGSGLHGKDLSKADVSVNIYCFLLAQVHNKVIEARCAIGDDNVLFYKDGQIWKRVKYSTIVNKAKAYIKKVGGFEKFAEWGLIK